jgi:hypothetical protein
MDEQKPRPFDGAQDERMATRIIVGNTSDLIGD